MNQHCGLKVNDGEGEVHVFERHIGLGDLDWLGHVNNVRMLEMVQDAQVRWFYVDRDPDAAITPCFVYASHDIQYVRELPMRSRPVRVETRVEKLGRSSVRLASRVCDDEGVYCQVKTGAIAFDTERGRPRQLTDDERVYMSRFQGGPEAGPAGA
jgi:acyl-CoA thioester hydrolase